MLAEDGPGSRGDGGRRRRPGRELLASVGRDVVAVRLDGGDRRTAYVALAAVAEVTLA